MLKHALQCIIAGRHLLIVKLRKQIVRIFDCIKLSGLKLINLLTNKSKLYDFICMLVVTGIGFMKRIPDKSTHIN